MKVKTVNSYNVQIWVGLKVGYSESTWSILELKAICQKYVNEKSYCVTVTPTEFIYKNGNEPGAIVGLVNYPRFPKTKKEIRKHAFKIAKILKKELKQFRVSITTPKKTFMLE